jgi:hypothetical protein
MKSLHTLLPSHNYHQVIGGTINMVGCTFTATVLFAKCVRRDVDTFYVCMCTCVWLMAHFPIRPY